MSILVKKVSITSNADTFKKEASEKINTWLEAIGQDAAGTAANYAPVDTGRLRNSISSVVDKSDHTVYVGTNVEYAPYQELGTSRGIEGKHFLEFGVTAHADEYQSMLEQQLKS